MDYLKDRQYYEDTYDIHTIETCLDYYSDIKKSFEEQRRSDEFKKYTPEEFNLEVSKVLNVMLRGIQGERYKNKAKTIQEWMDRDKKEQDKLDQAEAPAPLPCHSCGSPTLLTDKELMDSYETNSKVIFMYRCTKCKKGQNYYENGTEWDYKPPECPECKHPLNSDSQITNDVHTIIFTCPNCSYSRKSEYDFKKSAREREAKEKKDAQLLTDYRDKFCLSDTDGKEYIELMEALEVGRVAYEEELNKYDSPIYQKAAQIKELGIVELEKLLSKPLEKDQFIKLAFDKPEMSQQVLVPFSVQEGNLSRSEADSKKHLKNLITGTLEPTNWRLSYEGVSYRLGYLTGKLKGYEGKEAMFELAGKTDKPKLPNLDPEKRNKYEHHNVVELARLNGQLKGIENTRKRRLLTEPGGFHIDETGSYTCPICWNSMSGNTTWYDKWGLKCVNCKRNIDLGVIPPEINDYDIRKGKWLTKSQIEDKTGLHPASIRKFIRNGELKAKELKDDKGYVYYHLFLIDEVQDFLNIHLNQSKTETVKTT
jgi:hypothetical protein